MEKSILAKIVDWNKERKLNEQPFKLKEEISFIIEELLESTGEYKSIDARSKALELVKTFKDNDNDEEIIDAFGDIIVFATGTILKLGYDPDKVMEEIFKEIDSRKGKIIDGKFVKDPLIMPYKADLKKCKQQ